MPEMKNENNSNKYEITKFLFIRQIVAQIRHDKIFNVFENVIPSHNDAII